MSCFKSEFHLQIHKVSNNSVSYKFNDFSDHWKNVYVHREKGVSFLQAFPLDKELGILAHPHTCVTEIWSLLTKDEGIEALLKVYKIRMPSSHGVLHFIKWAPHENFPWDCTAIDAVHVHQSTLSENRWRPYCWCDAAIQFPTQTVAQDD